MNDEIRALYGFMGYQLFTPSTLTSFNVHYREIVRVNSGWILLFLVFQAYGALSRSYQTRAAFYCAIMTFLYSVCNFAFTFYYISGSQFYYLKKDSRDDLSDTESNQIYRAAWQFSLNSFASMFAALVGAGEFIFTGSVEGFATPVSEDAVGIGQLDEAADVV